MGLQSYLNMLLEGKIILSRKEDLNNNLRQKLAKIIVNYLIADRENLR